ncbi:Calmodulin-binding receptor-like cytoplasmic kinase 2 [Dionaea muscipula]
MHGGSAGSHRSHSSNVPTTPDRLSHSHNSSYSATSTSRASTSSAASSQSSVKSVTKSFVGVFAACFTPPDSEKETTSSVSTNGERIGNQTKRGSTRVVYAKPYNSTTDGEPGSVRFTMKQIYKATDNFSPALKIGQGGFGIVYKGTLDDGTHIAVKRAKKDVYDKHTSLEFQREVQILAQVEHLNLVKFYGFLEEEEERILVVEYVRNGTLREHLDGSRGDAVLNMATRLDIAIDVAHALTYLHMYTDNPIIHRDIKSSNILLTETYRAKVADFGFARLGAGIESGATHVSTQVKGTVGYLDPEYLRTNQLTDKSDVYSFGILLIELVTGRRPVDNKRDLFERITEKWAMKKFKNGEAISAMDPRLEKNEANNLVLERIFELAFQCLAPQRQSRPSMRFCVEVLWSIRKDCKELLAASDVRSPPSHDSRRSNSNSIADDMKI